VKVVTCRTAVYEALRRDADVYKEQEYEVLGIKAAEQPVFLEHVLETWGVNPDRAEELHRKVQQNTAVRPLAANPLMLTLIAEVSQRMSLPASRAAFYEAAVEEMWSRKLANSAAEDLLEERDRALSELAQRMALDLDKVESHRR
jgi:predicted NACHT family NTPase